MSTYCLEGSGLVTTDQTTFLAHIGHCEACEEAFAELSQAAGLPERRVAYIRVFDASGTQIALLPVTASSMRELRRVIPKIATPGADRIVYLEFDGRQITGISTPEALRKAAESL